MKKQKRDPCINESCFTQQDAPRTEPTPIFSVRFFIIEFFILILQKRE